MLDLFTIFSKGGIVLWYFQGTAELLSPSVNALIKSVILQERSGVSEYTHQSLTLKHKLDNEFELIFVVAYQKILQLSYIDKFLDDIQLEFRDRYKNSLFQRRALGPIKEYTKFTPVFDAMLKTAEQSNLQQVLNRPMRTFKDSDKSRKTVSSMVEKKGGDTPKGKKAKGTPNTNKNAPKAEEATEPVAVETSVEPATNGEMDEQTRLRNLEKLMQRGQKKGKVSGVAKKSTPTLDGKRKKATKWDHEGSKKDFAALDYSGAAGSEDVDVDHSTAQTRCLVGKYQGNVGEMFETSDEEEEDEPSAVQPELQSKQQAKKPKKSAGTGMFNMFKGLVGSKTVTLEDLEPVIAKMQEHLVAKNVAVDIAGKLCDSVASKLEGKVLGTFKTVSSTVRSTLEESCVQILSPRRRVDILRDALDAKDKRRPYVVTFCGVNGVGKSTNLAKIAFWLIENNLRVLIAGCDTFRAGAVEQLRTHERHLNSLHPAEQHGGSQMVKLYEKGYGKDPAGIAMEAINFARDQRFDVVLVDTAGRMQDNEPLMRALAKLIHTNQPDLVLFVGEALVGNEAVDQLVKFNQALADHSQNENPRLIDGIVLTKFDTIDDKVGAAISMTYTTGQPIVFVGTGQTYADLKNLNAKAVVKALMT